MPLLVAIHSRTIAPITDPSDPIHPFDPRDSLFQKDGLIAIFLILKTILVSPFTFVPSPLLVSN
jgi:hypothetical protein